MFHTNDPVAANRRLAMWITLDDGVTPAPAATDWTAQKAQSAALTSTNLTGAIVQVSTAGIAGNAKTLTLVHDGSGSVTVTTSGNAITAHYIAATSTVNQLQTALLSDGQIQLQVGSFTGANVLATGDAQGPIAVSGGFDLAWQLRAGGVTYANLAGTFTNTGIDGEWIIQPTQSELNFVGSECGLKLQRPGFATTIYTVPMGPLVPDVNVATVDTAAMQFIWEGAGIEGSNTPGDLMRLLSGMNAGLVGDFRTGLLAFKSLDGSKTRATITTDASGRIALTVGDLT